MNFSRFIAVVLFSLSLFAFSFAQEDNKKIQWNRIQSPDGEFSIEIPSNYIYFYDKFGFELSPANKAPYNFTEMHLLNASADKTVMRVEIYTVSKPKSYLQEIKRNDDMDGAKSKEELPGFIVQQIDQSNILNPKEQTWTEISHITKYIASKEHVYVISVANRGKATWEARHFLSSIRLNNKPPESSQEKIISLSDLKPLTIDQIAFDRSNEPDTKTAKPPETQPSAAEKKLSVVVLTKPQPTFTDNFRKSGRNFSDVLRMRVVLSATGGIPKVSLLSSLPGGLNRNSFFAAMRLRFIPAEKEDKMVDVTKVIEYHFWLY